MAARAGLRALPNIISSSRVLLAAAFVAAGDANARLGLVGIAGLTDFLDGWIARKGRWTSRVGALIDPIADRVFVLVAVLTFVYSQWGNNGTEVLPFAPVGSLIIDDPALATWTHRQLTPHPLACYTKPIRLHHPAGNGRPMTYIACTKPRYPVSAGMHEKVRAMAHIRFRPIEAGHNCIISAPDLVARELLAVPS